MSEEKPVYMLVLAKITDPKKMGAYQKALMDSGLYPDNGGGYLVKGRPIETFEGDWPGDHAAVIARFPSAENARSFWYSDEYQNAVKPLRAGAGEFTVTLFEESDEQ